MTCPVCGAELPQEALFCGECGSSVTAKPKTRPLVQDPRPSDTTVIDPLPGPAVAGPQRDRAVAAPVPAEPVPAEPVPAEPVPAVPVPADPVPAAPVPAEGVAVAFTLRMSTGERIVVSGTGLIGRRPIAQPGERFDQLVSVADTGRSVSKTHLEYGIQGGELWIGDRYSANGTCIVDASGAVRRCEPGRRYRVPRGARVEMGDQYIDVD
ncbi:MAG TPA: zinc-ribbon domain-containing protein [Humibacter sp.]|nr:zinc-ribbon domain-containing protein [Humibacter sp.]